MEQWHARIDRWGRSRSRDVVVAVVMTALAVGGSYGEAHPSEPYNTVIHGHHVPPTPSAAFLLVALAAAVLVERRRHREAVLTISTLATATYCLLGYVAGAVLLVPAIALYALTSTTTARRALGWGAATLVVLLVSMGAANPFGTFGGGFDVIPALIAVATFGGIAVSSRRAFVASVESRAADDARRRMDSERLRIARELHDVVAHTMATINVQASAASLLLADRPDQAADALVAIKVASKEGLRELRAILGVLRQVDDADPTTPTPGLGDIETLIGSATGAGLATALVVSGPPAALPAAVDLAAYRIVQESLTNAIRHAGPATATVAIHYTPDELAVTVTDTGTGAAPHGTGGLHPASGAGGLHPASGAGGLHPASGAGGLHPASGAGGHGLTGMRERAASVGGSLAGGPLPSGGWQVAARLPLDPGPLQDHPLAVDQVAPRKHGPASDGRRAPRRAPPGATTRSPG